MHQAFTQVHHDLSKVNFDTELRWVRPPLISFGFLLCAVINKDDETELLVDAFCVNGYFLWLYSRHLDWAQLTFDFWELHGMLFFFSCFGVLTCLRSDDDWWRGWATRWYVLCQRVFLVITIEAFVWAHFFTEWGWTSLIRCLMRCMATSLPWGQNRVTNLTAMCLCVLLQFNFFWISFVRCD